LNIKLRAFSRFSRDAKLLIAVSGIFAVSFFGVQTLLKVLYLLRLGYSTEYIGLFNASGALVYMGMGLPSGALGSRFGARRIMLLGGAAAVSGMAILPLTEFTPPALETLWPVLSQIVLTVGWSMYNVNLVPALMAATTEKTRNDAYALSSALREIGGLVGTLFGGMLPGIFAALINQSLDAPAPYRFALWVGAILGLTVLIPLSLIKRSPPVTIEKQTRAKGAFPVLPVALMVVYVYFRHAGWATCQSFCNAYMDTDLHLSASSIGLLTSAGQVAAILAALLSSRLIARHSTGKMLITATIGTGLSLLPLALLPHWTGAGLGRLGVQVLSTIWITALQVYQMELVDAEWRSMSYGTISMAMGLGFGSLSLVGGYIIATYGYRSLFLLGTGLSLFSAALMWGILKYQNRASIQMTVASTNE